MPSSAFLSFCLEYILFRQFSLQFDLQGRKNIHASIWLSTAHFKLVLEIAVTQVTKALFEKGKLRDSEPDPVTAILEKWRRKE